MNEIKNINIELKPSNIHGVGLFAIKTIPNNTIVFTYIEPKIKTYNYKDLRKNGVSNGTIDMLKRIYAHNDKYIEIPQKFRANTLHYVNFLNHSNKSNVYYKNGNYISRRNIKKGEEILLNYNENNYCKTCLDF